MKTEKPILLWGSLGRLSTANDARLDLLLPLFWGFFDVLGRLRKQSRLAMTRMLSNLFAGQIPRGAVACKSGCSRCCRIEVSVSDEEGRDLAPFVPPEKIPKLFIQREMSAEKYEWNDVSECVFLSQDGCCSVYEKRPMACRAAFSKDPATCGPGPALSMIPFDARIDALASAYFSHDNEPDKMAKVLLRHLRKVKTP